MKILLIGGTGTISAAITRRLLAQKQEVWLLNRGRSAAPEGCRLLAADIRDEAAARRALGDERFDAVCEFVAFTPEHVQTDLRLFAGRTAQYVFISSASAYQKPPRDAFVTESTPLHNPYWQYSRDKQACEELLMAEYRRAGFPVTIVRPSHTYGDGKLPVALHGEMGAYQVLCRIRAGKPVIVPGDGATLWTLTHNSDFAKAFCGLLGNVHAIGEAYHITSDERLTWNQIYDILGQAVGRAVEKVHIPTDALVLLRPEWAGPLLGDKSNCALFDNAKIKQAVPDFVCTTRFDMGARASVAYLDSHPACQTPDPAFDAWCDHIADAWRKMLPTLPRD